MVCDRCIYVIKNILHNLEIQPVSVEMGMVEFENKLSDDETQRFREAIEVVGFELLDDNNQVLIEQVKALLIKLVHKTQDIEKINISEFIGSNLQHDYPSLSQLFSSVEGLTIEKYFIQLRVERVKELLVYDELNLTEISYRLAYSSLAHLSAQFKQVTGMTATTFKNLKNNTQRRSLDKI